MVKKCQNREKWSILRKVVKQCQTQRYTAKHRVECSVCHSFVSSDRFVVFDISDSFDDFDSFDVFDVTLITVRCHVDNCSVSRC